MGFFSNLFKDYNTRQVEKIKKIADKVMAYDEEYTHLTDEELRAKTAEFKDRYKGGESLDSMLPEAYAVVREAAMRTLNMKHFYEQVIGGIALHQGRIAEMKTGEGKTLVATLPAYLNALTGKGMHIVTVNDYLARRDAEWMGKIYKFLGLSVGIIVHGMDNDAKREAYASDIVYATNSELGFDYLRDNMAVRKEDRVLRGLEFAIVDEVDSILIDEARTPLIISGSSSNASNMYLTANRFARTLSEDDCIIEEKERTVRLDDSGVEKAERFFKIDNLGDIENQDIAHYINNAIKARFGMFRDKDYLVQDGEVILIDEFTGRTMIGRRYSDGLHQALEAKEGVRIHGENKTLATITYQNFFRLYGKLSGMTGTAKSEESEFKDIYNIDVLVIPTHRPVARIDESDRLYTTKKGKIKAIVEDIKACYERHQPVLVGTISVDKSEMLSSMLKKEKIPHNVLNAKNHESEAEIVAQAGKEGMVTIATNMAGRGTDIMLGGNPEFMAEEKLRNLGYSHEDITMASSLAHTDDANVIKAREDYAHYLALFKEETDKAKERVKELGGLRIIGTERHESRRIDDQLRGRSGRQGDPGSSVFYLSMEDDMVKVFGGDSMKAVADRLIQDDDFMIENKLLTRLIESAQSRVEDRNFSIRKNVLRYDGIMNSQRASIYEERNKVLEGLNVHDQIVKMMDTVVDKFIATHIDYSIDYYEWDYVELNKAIESVLLNEGTNAINEDVAERRKIRETILAEAVEQYNTKAEALEAMNIDFAEIERSIMLSIVDRNWIEHIDNMDRLKQGIGLAAYAQRDPAMVYQQEGANMFDEMVEKIQEQIVTVMAKAEINANVERRSTIKETPKEEEGVKTVVNKGKKIGRNDPCPCGSGKKYKNCCGR